ncbi:MAG: serine protease [Caldilineaceae bacterium]
MMFSSFRLLSVLLLIVFLLLQPAAANAAPDDPGIVGGQDVPDPNPYVWQVGVFIDGSLSCGGSIVADRWILTAAHCVVLQISATQIADVCRDVNLAPFRQLYQIVVGRRALSDTATGRVMNVNRCIHHPDYDPNTTVNDIALIELAEAIPNAASMIVPLMTASQEVSLGAPDVVSTITGWGGLNGYPPGPPPSNQQFPDVLQFVEIPIITNAQCVAAYEDLFGVGNSGVIDSMVCAGLPEGGRDSCQGDSGGPMVVPDGKGGYIQNGIVSTGAGCAHPGVPGIYTRISAFVDWVNSVTGMGIDLVVEKVNVTSTGVQVVIKNQGTLPVVANQGFWVDVYINPTQPPTQVNEIWNFLSAEGLVWGVDSDTTILQPGQSMTLSIGDKFYMADLSVFSGTIAADAAIYAQVDSANANTNYGGVLENHEATGGAYNNIYGPTFIQAAAAQLESRLYLPFINFGDTASLQVTSAKSRAPIMLPSRAFNAQEEE